MKHCPEGCASKAREAEEDKDWKTATMWWNSAYAVTIGHNRRDRYEACADRCAKEAGLQHSWDAGFAP